MVELLKYLLSHPELIVLTFLLIEKIVKLTPTKYDDIIVDMILKPIIENFKKGKVKK